MTKTNMDLSELLAKHDQGDLLRSIAEAVLQLIMEADVEGLIGAGRHERSGERTTWRNGYRERALDTRLGTLNLRVPKLRQGSYFPGFLEARKTSEQALVAVIQEAWIGGVSTRRVDDLVQASSRILKDRLGPGSSAYHVDVVSYALLLDEARRRELTGVPRSQPRRRSLPRRTSSESTG